jgi:hypothetical protein
MVIYMINIEFEITKDDYTFKDAIILEDNHGLSDEQIDTMKQKRFDDWYAIVTAPSEEQPVTEEVTE